MNMLLVILSILPIIADSIGIITGFGVLFAWFWAILKYQSIVREKERKNTPINVILKSGDKNYILPSPIRRYEFNRAEVLGRLGMIPMQPSNKKEKKRFNLEHTNSDEFMRHIDDIQQHSTKSLTIPCSTEEFSQFRFD